MLDFISLSQFEAVGRKDGSYYVYRTTIKIFQSKNKSFQIALKAILFLLKILHCMLNLYNSLFQNALSETAVPPPPTHIQCAHTNLLTSFDLLDMLKRALEG